MSIFSVLGRKNDDEKKDGLFAVLCSDGGYTINSFGHNGGNILTAATIICLIDDGSYCTMSYCITEKTRAVRRITAMGTCISSYCSNMFQEETFPNHYKLHVRARGLLMHNTRIEKPLNKKMKPRYLGPLIVVSRNKGGAYILCELDGSVLQNPIAQFRVLPYFARKSIFLPEGFIDIGAVLGQHQNPTPWIMCGLYKGTQQFLKM